MKHLFCSLLILLCCLSAQALELDWRLDEHQVWCLENGLREDSAHLDIFSEFIVDNQAIGIGIQYPLFEEIKGASLRAMLPLLQQTPLADTLQLQVTKGLYRKQDCWDIHFYPYICRDKKYYRLISFDWKIQNSQSPLLQQDIFASQADFTALRNGEILNDASRYAETSVLSKGKWQKISVTENGVYRLTYDELKKMGIDPKKAQVYGYGGHLLAENFSDKTRPYIDDLPKVPMYKNETGKYILFYANGLHRWVYDRNKKMYVRELNHYSNKAYYFVGESQEGQLLMQNSEEIGEVTSITETYTDFVLHENDWTNVGSTGRECFGESFISTTRQDFLFDMGNHYASEENSDILIEFMARNSVYSSCIAYLNEASIGSMGFREISANDNYTYGIKESLHKRFQVNSPQLNVTLQYRNGGLTPKAAYLDKITLNLRKQIHGNQSVLLFRDPMTVAIGQIVEYRIADAGSHHIVLDVSNSQAPRIVPTYLKDDKLCFRASADELKEFALVNLKASLPSPKKEGSVTNQNLHALGAQDFIIISHKDFLEEAETLAQAHREHDGLRCVVVEAQQIYNEFSSGTPDATAYRRLMKMFYDRAENEGDMPKLLLLFGDGVFDNRLVTHQFSGFGSQPNKLLTYQSEESLIGTSSYVSDDYFAVLDDTEGANLASDKIDIGVGRFPVRNKQEAAIALNKSLNYLRNKDKGNWKNSLCFMSDDGDNNTHISHADALAEIVRNNHPEFIINKIYVDAFERETSASGTKMPDPNQRLKQLLNHGLLLLNSI